MKVIGLIKILDPQAFEIYRSRVGTTVEHYNGKISFRGEKKQMLWNELECEDFDAFVELEFQTEDDAYRWTNGPEYTELLAVRSKAMQLTLFSV